MATLKALVEDRLLLLGEEKASKQSKRVSLIADPGITVTALMEAVGCFMQSKSAKIFGLCAASPWQPHLVWVAQFAKWRLDHQDLVSFV